MYEDQSALGTIPSSNISSKSIAAFPRVSLIFTADVSILGYIISLSSIQTQNPALPQLYFHSSISEAYIQKAHEFVRDHLNIEYLEIFFLDACGINLLP